MELVYTSTVPINDETEGIAGRAVDFSSSIHIVMMRDLIRGAETDILPMLKLCSSWITHGEFCEIMSALVAVTVSHALVWP